VAIKIVDGVEITLTDSEVTAREAEEKTFNDAAPARRMAKLRQERDWLLQKTDYMALGDVTMTDVWKTYRQALRDITDTYSSMSDDGFAFPTKPS
tara:strand:+ start:588 stop:872 length:285 start_codon:yes stop_codon:yes gene_type:complete